MPTVGVLIGSIVQVQVNKNATYCAVILALGQICEKSNATFYLHLAPAQII